MDTFFEYWKKGWKVILMMFCVNLAGCLLFIPIAIIVFMLVGRNSKELYYFLSIILGIIFAPAITYSIFKYFYGEQ